MLEDRCTDLLSEQRGNGVSDEAPYSSEIDPLSTLDERKRFRERLQDGALAQ